jgi:hypothetical protein
MRIRDEVGGDFITSLKLVAKLKEDPEAPWAEYNRGKGLTQNSLASLLRGGGGRGRRGKRVANGSPTRRAGCQRLQVGPVRGCLEPVSDPLVRQGRGLGRRIDRPSVQTRMNKGQVMKIDCPQTVHRPSGGHPMDALWTPCFSEKSPIYRHLDVWTVYSGGRHPKGEIT